ncbi:MAG: CheR family methyltransferase [Succinivibrionaceae bacterium]
MVTNGLLKDSISKENYELFCEFLQRKCGIVLGDNKQYLVRSRLSGLIATYNFENLNDLLEKTVNGNNRELHACVVDAMTTNETLWFRDNYPFDYLVNTIYPEFSSNRTIRIWSAASSSGQEPYSISMATLEQESRPKGVPSSKVNILATDISPTMLDICRNGVYDGLALTRGLSEKRKQAFFELVNGKSNIMRIKNEVRKLVTFKQFNLLDSYALLGRFDVIFCRNVLIYFSPEVKQQIILNFYKILNPGGYLFLGSSEYLPVDKCDFEMVRCNPGMVFRKKR